MIIANRIRICQQLLSAAAPGVQARGRDSKNRLGPNFHLLPINAPKAAPRSGSSPKGVPDGGPGGSSASVGFLAFRVLLGPSIML